jgi:predicted Zn-dependent peptidase
LNTNTTYHRSVLENGLRVLTAPMPETRSVSITILVGSGSRYETAEEAGVSHFIEHMMFKGTSRFPSSKEISEAIEGVGGYMNAGTEREATVYWVKVARPHFWLALDLLADLLRNSLFREEDWEKERKIILEELNSTEDIPQQKVDFLIDALLWPDQPMGRDIAGTKETVQNMSREKALEYKAAQYVPNNIVVSVAGAITHEEVVDSVARALGDLSPGEPRPWFPALNGQDRPRARVEYRKTEQAHLCLALRGLSSLHPDRYALDLLSTILGEGMSSRLFLELREKGGLCYDVFSAPNHYLDAGSLTIYAGVDPQKTAHAIEGILDQLALLRLPIPEEELTKVKELSKGRMLLRMEDTRSVAGWLGTQEMLFDQVKTVDQVVEQVDRITVADLERVGKTLLSSDKLSLALVGPFRSGGRFLRLLKL